MYNGVKRFIDYSVAVLLIVALSPVFISIYVLIRIFDGGSPIFSQKRVGLHGHCFNLYKFRSMKLNVQGGYSTQENDPRITKIGYYLRRLSLDELPQLINLLKGDMSLIGPRPDVPEQQLEYTPEQREKRNSVLPGITGLAQATKRSLATPEERMGYDLEYVDKKSFVLDCKIILLTIKSLLKKNVN